MDKHCKDCKYRVFKKDDTNDRWGFCKNPNIPKGKDIPKVKSKPVAADDYPNVVLSKLPNDTIPSCMVVQSFYDGNCPWRNTVDGE